MNTCHTCGYSVEGIIICRLAPETLVTSGIVHCSMLICECKQGCLDWLASSWLLDQEAFPEISRVRLPSAMLPAYRLTSTSIITLVSASYGEQRIMTLTPAGQGEANHFFMPV